MSFNPYHELEILITNRTTEVCDELLELVQQKHFNFSDLENVLEDYYKVRSLKDWLKLKME